MLGLFVFCLLVGFSAQCHCQISVENVGKVRSEWAGTVELNLSNALLLRFLSTTGWPAMRSGVWRQGSSTTRTAPVCLGTCMLVQLTQDIRAKPDILTCSHRF